MITPKEDVFERGEQSFDLLRKNFLKICIPLFLLYSSFAIWKEIFTVYVFSSINISEESLRDPLLFFLQTDVIIAISVLLLAWLVFWILYMFFYVATFKSIVQAYRWDESSISSNIKYGYRSIINVSKVYWYNFSYVYLIPTMVFIAWFFIILIASISGISDFIEKWIWVLIFSVFVFIAFSIYRWTKASFFVCSAIDKESYTKENFKQSVLFTRNNWWRIVWNLILISIAIWFISSIIKGLIFAFFPSSFSVTDILDGELLGLVWSWNLEVTDIVGNIADVYFSNLAELNIWNVIKSLLWSTIEVIFTAFSMTFLYVLFKRLELEHFESEWVEIKNISAMKKENRVEKEQVKRERGVIDEL